MTDKNIKVIIFSTLAFNQTLFFVKIAKKLAKSGYEVKFISFHQRSNKYITQNNFDVFDVFDYQKNAPAIDYLEIENQFNINLNRLISHEKYFYRESSSNIILNKVGNYFYALENIFNAIEDTFHNKFTIVHELGGVTPIQVLYHIAQNRKYDNIFFEPAFISNRILLIKNSMNALPIKMEKIEFISDEVNKYLIDTLRNKNIVVPSKDKWRHGSTFNIISNFRWYKRLFEKTVDKHFFGKKEEFNYIHNWVNQHLRMIINRVRIKPHYKKIPVKYIYFPLHVPADMALTVRAPELLDQYTLIDYLARSIPITHKLIVKEHPAFVGGIDYKRIRSLLKTHDNIILCRPDENNYDVVEKSDLVITINSKAGAEAIISKKPVIVLGDAFYKDTPLVSHVKDISMLMDLIPTLLESDNKKLSDKEITRFVQAIWNQSIPGELYDVNDRNIDLISNALDISIKAC